MTDAELIETLRPFARVAQLLKPTDGGVLLSLRLADAPRTDFVQLRATDFHRAAAAAAALQGQRT